MEKGKSSTTAWAVAMARAAHVKFDPAPPLFDDSLVLDLIDPDIQPYIEMFGPSDAVPNEVYRHRPYLAFRQRYQEERLAEAYHSGVRQYVILGAGLDSYAFRQPGDRADLNIFEVDFPDTQMAKRQRIGALAWPWPANLYFAPCDFETEDLSSALLAAGFDSSQPAYYAWMGVTVYLAPATVEQTLAQLLGLSATGSRIAFEYAPPIDQLSGSDRLCREYSLAQSEIRKSEPHITFFETRQFEQLLTTLGYRWFDPLDHALAASQVLAGRDDDLGIHHGFRLATAGW